MYAAPACSVRKLSAKETGRLIRPSLEPPLTTLREERKIPRAGSVGRAAFKIKC